MIHTERASSVGAGKAERNLTASQRALEAAWQSGRFVPDAAQRRRTRTRAPDGLGKTSQKVAAQARVSARLVESALIVLNHGTRGLREAVQAGIVTVSDAARVARLPHDTQNLALLAVKEGRASTLAAALVSLVRQGFEEHILTETITALNQLLEERRRLSGPHQEYIRAHEMLGQLRAAVVKWRVAMPGLESTVSHDAQGGYVPAKHYHAFQNASQIVAIIRTLTDLANQIESLRDQYGGQLIREDQPYALRKVCQALANACPWIVCPDCRGIWPNCAACNMKGWLSRPEIKPVIK
jgi:hypothetical protein